ncbi:hypothetical protein D3C72_1515910 [compost metagenome]
MQRRVVDECAQRMRIEHAARKHQPQTGKRDLDGQRSREEAADSHLERLRRDGYIVRIRQHGDRRLGKALGDGREIGKQAAASDVPSRQIERNQTHVHPESPVQACSRDHIDEGPARKFALKQRDDGGAGKRMRFDDDACRCIARFAAHRS